MLAIFTLVTLFLMNRGCRPLWYMVKHFLQKYVSSLSSPDAIRKAFFQTVLEIGQKSQKSQTRNSWLGLFLKIALIHHGQHHPEISGTIRGYFLQLVKTKSPLGGINKSCFSFSNKLPSLNLTASLHLKIDGWNTILFLFGKVYFQVRTVGFIGRVFDIKFC